MDLGKAVHVGRITPTWLSALCKVGKLAASCTRGVKGISRAMSVHAENEWEDEPLLDGADSDDEFPLDDVAGYKPPAKDKGRGLCKRCLPTSRRGWFCAILSTIVLLVLLGFGISFLVYFLCLGTPTFQVTHLHIKDLCSTTLELDLDVEAAIGCTSLHVNKVHVSLLDASGTTAITGSTPSDWSTTISNSDTLKKIPATVSFDPAGIAVARDLLQTYALNLPMDEFNYTLVVDFDVGVSFIRVAEQITLSWADLLSRPAPPPPPSEPGPSPPPGSNSTKPAPPVGVRVDSSAWGENLNMNISLFGDALTSFVTIGSLPAVPLRVLSSDSVLAHLQSTSPSLSSGGELGLFLSLPVGQDVYFMLHNHPTYARYPIWFSASEQEAPTCLAAQIVDGLTLPLDASKDLWALLYSIRIEPSSPTSLRFAFGGNTSQSIVDAAISAAGAATAAIQPRLWMSLFPSGSQCQLATRALTVEIALYIGGAANSLNASIDFVAGDDVAAMRDYILTPAWSLGTINDVDWTVEIATAEDGGDRRMLYACERRPTANVTWVHDALDAMWRSPSLKDAPLAAVSSSSIATSAIILQAVFGWVPQISIPDIRFKFDYDDGTMKEMR